MMRLTDAAVRGNYKKEQKRTSRVMLGLIPAVLLAIWHLPPLMMAQYLAGTKIKTIEFSSPVRWGGSLGLYLVYYPAVDDHSTRAGCLLVAARAVHRDAGPAQPDPLPGIGTALAAGLARTPANAARDQLRPENAARDFGESAGSLGVVLASRNQLRIAPVISPNIV